MTDLLFVLVPIILLPIAAYAALTAFPADQLERTAAAVGRLALAFLLLALGVAALRGGIAVMTAASDDAPDVGWLWTVAAGAGLLALIVGSFAAAAFLASRRTGGWQ